MLQKWEKPKILSVHFHVRERKGEGTLAREGVLANHFAQSLARVCPAFAQSLSRVFCLHRFAALIALDILLVDLSFDFRFNLLLLITRYSHNER